MQILVRVTLEQLFWCWPPIEKASLCFPLAWALCGSSFFEGGAGLLCHAGIEHLPIGVLAPLGVPLVLVCLASLS